MLHQPRAEKTHDLHYSFFSLGCQNLTFNKSVKYPFSAFLILMNFLHLWGGCFEPVCKPRNFLTAGPKCMTHSCNTPLKTAEPAKNIFYIKHNRKSQITLTVHYEICRFIVLSLARYSFQCCMACLHNLYYSFITLVGLYINLPFFNEFQCNYFFINGFILIFSLKPNIKQIIKFLKQVHFGGFPPKNFEGRLQFDIFAKKY